MELIIFYAMITAVCYFDPLCDARTSGPAYFRYSKSLDRVLSLFRWLYRREWRDSYHQICWHWLKWFRFYTPFIAYVIACRIGWIDCLLGAAYAHLLWRWTYDYYTKARVK